MGNLVPKKLFFTKGVGIASDPLLSFEYALRDAKIEKFNLVAVSSIVPPNIKIVSIEEGLKYLKAGEVVFCVISRFTSDKKGKEIFNSSPFSGDTSRCFEGKPFEKGVL